MCKGVQYNYHKPFIGGEKNLSQELLEAETIAELTPPTKPPSFLRARFECCSKAASDFTSCLMFSRLMEVEEKPPADLLLPLPIPAEVFHSALQSIVTSRMSVLKHIGAYK